MASSLITGITEIKRKINRSGSSSSSQRHTRGEGSDTSPSLRRYQPQTLDYFLSVTDFSKREICSLYRNFKNECPTGIVNEDTFKTIYSQFFPNGDAKGYAHYVFRAFDVNEDGQIDFEQFIIGLSTLLRGTLQDRLRWTFRLYDINHDGVISKEEMLLVIKSLYKMLGADSSTSSSGGSRYHDDKGYIHHADIVFNKFDTNRDGHITLNEFSQVCLQDESIIMSMSIFDHAI